MAQRQFPPIRTSVNEDALAAAEISLREASEALSYLRRIWYSIQEIQQESSLTIRDLSESFGISRNEFYLDLRKFGLKADDLREARTLDDLFRKATKLQWIPSCTSKNSES